MLDRAPRTPAGSLALRTLLAACSGGTASDDAAIADDAATGDVRGVGSVDAGRGFPQYGYWNVTALVRPIDGELEDGRTEVTHRFTLELLGSGSRATRRARRSRVARACSSPAIRAPLPVAIVLSAPWEDSGLPGGWLRGAPSEAEVALPASARSRGEVLLDVDLADRSCARAGTSVGLMLDDVRVE